MSSPGSGLRGAPEDRRAFLQTLVDQAAQFHLYSAPAGDGALVHASEIRVNQPLHPFAIEQSSPAAGAGIGVSNRIGPSCGTLSLRCIPIDWEDRVQPGQPPGEVPFGGPIQRFAVLDSCLQFEGGHALELFGTGRFFPVTEAGRQKVLGAGICNVVAAKGSFAGIEGNVTFCGELSPDVGFRGHIMVRLRDPRGVLRADSPLDDFPDTGLADPDATYLTWLGRKTDAAQWLNTPSFTPTGQVRGLNIPLSLHQVSTRFAITPRGFRVNPIEAGVRLGKETGFARNSVPQPAGAGTALLPIQFEGVSLTGLFDAEHSSKGTFTSNFLEGRSFTVRYDGAPDEPGLRYGFFGPGIASSGCFAGSQGILYGASGSVFNPPPGIHVISNWCVLRLSDPDHRFRTNVGGL